ncbi:MULTISPECIES: FadR/GntR family transcriptional regulator [unclassified Frondihabitans]|uniref:FadR/GntR family transcriptional regulator n=1 Tax=unclassified Frondihabitans TaxID=2626248 RepID=UPI000F4E5201|nr:MULTISPECIES: FadR/GntR family transcriptional regulator [unclassified Frondihabitans]RPE76361.1 GntR family transcriptional repressor for pyruvate dehydrogenase complex [Frondihabitans sp. PhB153]RPF05363.1 GntR family transcriptional repressor for pyruvate dehydrogenase complex [Frondihabitans sp. PhB161]
MPAYPDDDPAALRLELEAVPRGTAVAEVVKQLISLLTSGELAPGSRLPPERQLAEKLGVGRSAVRESLAALEILGIVTVRPGSGTYLRDSTSELLPTTLSWGLMLSASRTRELIEVRSGLEIQAATYAASRITDAEIAALGSHIETMKATLDDLDRFVEADVRFHLQIAASADNVVLRDLLQSVRSLLRLWVERGLRDREQGEVALREHIGIYEAIAARDPAAAEAAMRVHMSTAGDRVASLDLDT